MTRYRIAEVRQFGVTDWVVIATNDDGSLDWGTRHSTEAEAKAVAERLNAIQEATTKSLQ